MSPDLINGLFELAGAIALGVAGGICIVLVNMLWLLLVAVYA